MALAAKHPFLYVWLAADGRERTVRILGERTDEGGSEGYPAERQVGGRWDREYRAYADSFPERPTEEGRVVDGIDDAEMPISSVEAVQLPPYPVIYSLRCRRLGATP